MRTLPLGGVLFRWAGVGLAGSRNALRLTDKKSNIARYISWNHIRIFLDYTGLDLNLASIHETRFQVANITEGLSVVQAN